MADTKSTAKSDTAAAPGLVLIPPPLLQTLALYELSLDLCRRMAHKKSKPGTYFELDYIKLYDFRIEVASMIKGLPNFVIDMVDNCLHHDHVIVSIANWCRYHKFHVFYDVDDRYFHDAVLKCMDEFVLKHDGTIDYLLTAKNIILKADRLSAMDKFRFACINCLEDDIKRFWPLVSENREFVDSVDSSSFCGRHSETPILLQYWIKVMKGELEQSYYCIPTDDWLCNIMDNSHYLDRTPIEYVWNLTPDVELRNIFAEGLLDLNLDKRGVPDLFEFLFAKLDDGQIQSILLERETTMVKTFFCPLIEKGRRYSGLLLSAWNRLKHLLSPNEFNEIICEFMRSRFMTPNGLDDSVLFEMWKTAPASFKKRILNDTNNLRKIFKKFEIVRYSGFTGLFCTFDLPFFVALLSELNFETRNALWCEFWPNFIIPANLDCLRNMMRICFNNDEDIKRFKERDMMVLEKIEFFCYLLIMHRHISELEQFLSFCSSNEELVIDLKRQILQSPKVQTEIARTYFEWPDYVPVIQNFIASAFSNKNHLKKYKNKFLKKHGVRLGI